MALLQVTEDNFDTEVLTSSVPVLVDVWGPRCVPCVALDPVMEDLAEEYRDRVKIVKIVAPESRKLCASLKVMGLPTMLAYVDGDETTRIGGNDLGAPEVRSLVQSLAE